MTDHTTPPHPEGDPSLGQTASQNTPAGLRILLADDDVINQRLGCLLLERLGHRAVCVANGLEALQQLAANPFDVVILDVEMPELGGPETAIRIRSGTSGVLNPAIPLLGLSGHGQGPECASCLEAGMNGYLAKPLRADDLKRVLAEIVPRM